MQALQEAPQVNVALVPQGIIALVDNSTARKSLAHLILRPQGIQVPSPSVYACQDTCLLMALRSSMALAVFYALQM